MTFTGCVLLLHGISHSFGRSRAYIFCFLSLIHRHLFRFVWQVVRLCARTVFFLSSVLWTRQMFQLPTAVAVAESSITYYYCWVCFRLMARRVRCHSNISITCCEQPGREQQVVCRQSTWNTAAVAAVADPSTSGGTQTHTHEPFKWQIKQIINSCVASIYAFAVCHRFAWIIAVNGEPHLFDERARLQAHTHTLCTAQYMPRSRSARVYVWVSAESFAPDSMSVSPSSSLSMWAAIAVCDAYDKYMTTATVVEILMRRDKLRQRHSLTNWLTHTHARTNARTPLAQTSTENLMFVS